MANKSTSLQEQVASSFLSGGNQAYIEELYDSYLQDPNSVPTEWRSYFSQLPAVNGALSDTSHAEIINYFRDLAKNGQRSPVVAVSGDIAHEQKQTRVNQLIEAYRRYGHLISHIDPLSLLPIPKVTELLLSTYGLTDNDLSEVFSCGDISGLRSASLREILAALHKIYCETIAIQYAYINNTEEREWVKARVERGNKTSFSAEQKQTILRSLAMTETFEKYLGNRFVGQKRFSIEGGDSLIPLLHETIQHAGNFDVKEMVIGMAHRGRLNVLINVIGKAPAMLYREFEGKHVDDNFAGDVKYHLGFSSDVKTQKGSIHLSLGFNPSHLEFVDPVVEGSVRSRQDRRNDVNRAQVVPLLIHGDSSVAGQGIVMETLNMSQTRGFGTGGTIHIIVNNQVGFTTSDPTDTRSTLYCSDIAKMLEVPVFHVNGDDPEAVVTVAQWAVEYRMKFKKDVFIDLVCYRRHGHNEADEPAATQPVMYKVIRQLPTTYALYAKRLLDEKVVTESELTAFIDNYRNALDKGEPVLTNLVVVKDKFAIDWTPYLNKEWRMPVNTAVPLARLQELGKKLLQFSDKFVLQPQVQKEIESRQKMFAGEALLHWGAAETLAYASLVTEHVPVRLSGQDSGRGTFSHRHSVLVNYETGEKYTPLQNLSEDQASFVVIDSILSEAAAVGFEYGYACSAPNYLVLWEAQFGDFVNGAQVVIDQFMSSGEQKWGRLCGLTMLLPHGMEGMGAEHSSARMERFLQLCAQQNMQVCVPTTPAQIFHLLRRQAIRPYRKPLIVMTPKSLLRHKLAVSSMQDLSEGQFQLVIPNAEQLKNSAVEQLILCSGKVYYDLLEKRTALNRSDVAIIRVEQLYPFPQEEVLAELTRYKNVTDVIWCQEEPKNQGAWYYIQPRLTECLQKKQVLRYIGRNAAAAPAAGAPYLHQKQQAALVDAAFQTKLTQKEKVEV